MSTQDQCQEDIENRPISALDLALEGITDDELFEIC